jgi:hypothetical protein
VLLARRGIYALAKDAVGSPLGSRARGAWIPGGPAH